MKLNIDGQKSPRSLEIKCSASGFFQLTYSILTQFEFICFERQVQWLE